MPRDMTLLFITQKLHGQDAFGALWIKAFEKIGYTVEVICLENRADQTGALLGSENPMAATVHSLAKEHGASKMSQILRFMWLITTLKYDRVFIHMTPVWGIFGAPVWMFRRVPVYLWYTHYTMQLGLWLLGLYAKRMFCATPQSLPQYEGSPKKIVTGHGIDLSFWPKRPNHAKNPHQLLIVHRLARSKRVELIIRALKQMSEEFTIDIYGIEAEPQYVKELHALVQELYLSERITFHGTKPAKELAELYQLHHLILNMASETIDKTMLEAMTCGCYPVTTKANALAIGIPQAPAKDTPEAIKDFILQHCKNPPITGDQMYHIVQEGHSLEGLMKKMDSYIRSGT